VLGRTEAFLRYIKLDHMVRLFEPHLTQMAPVTTTDLASRID